MHSISSSWFHAAKPHGELPRGIPMGGSPWGSIIGASILFTAMHIESTAAEGLPGLFVLSLGFGWAFARTGRLASAVTMHILFNALNIFMMLQIVET